MSCRPRCAVKCVKPTSQRSSLLVLSSIDRRTVCGGLLRRVGATCRPKDNASRSWAQMLRSLGLGLGLGLGLCLSRTTLIVAQSSNINVSVKG